MPGATCRTVTSHDYPKFGRPAILTILKVPPSLGDEEGQVPWESHVSSCLIEPSIDGGYLVRVAKWCFVTTLSASQRSTEKPAESRSRGSYEVLKHGKLQDENAVPILVQVVEGVADA